MLHVLGGLSNMATCLEVAMILKATSRVYFDISRVYYDILMSINFASFHAIYHKDIVYNS